MHLGLVAVDKLNSDEILSRDVRDINGRLLLAKGKTINAEHIRLLKIWGVPEVIILDTKKEAEPSYEKPSEKRQSIELGLRKMLQNIDADHPAIAAVINAAIDHRDRNDLLLEYKPPRPLSPDFRLDLYSAIQTQIQFSKIELPESDIIVSQYNQVVSDPHASASDIADVVAKSPSLAAFVLKIVNSAAFGLASKIDTISRAVALLGTRELGMLVMGIGIMRLFHSMPKNLIDMHTFVRHSLACGLLSRILAAQANMRETEQMFVSGLLHDIGRLVWYRYFPEQAKLCLEIAGKTGLPLYDIENECLGVSHEQIAAQLLQKWNVPDNLADCIVYHHRPSRCTNPNGPAIVHMADLAVNALGLGHSGEHIIPRFESGAWDQLKVSPNALTVAIGQTVQQVEIMGTLLLTEIQDD
jgi:putative nucleotidyltransferase with HDIG domain